MGADGRSQHELLGFGSVMMLADGEVELLALLGAGDSLRITAQPHDMAGRTCYRLSFTIHAHPFSGIAADVFEADELRRWADALLGLASGSKVHLGAERTVGLTLSIEDIDTSKKVAVVRWVSSDEQVALDYSIFDLDPFEQVAAERIHELVGSEG